MKALLPLALLTLAPAFALAAPTIWSANDHAYELITQTDGTGTYASAKAAAEARTFRGVQGRLLVLETPTYAAERDFVSGTVIRPNAPATGYWIGVTRPAAGGSVREGWTWNDGLTVPTSVTNTWNIDGFEGSLASNGYGAIFFSGDNYSTPYDYILNDSGNLSGGYVVEFASPVPEPATMAALGLGALALLKRRRKSV